MLLLPQRLSRPIQGPVRREPRWPREQPDEQPVPHTSRRKVLPHQCANPCAHAQSRQRATAREHSSLSGNASSNSRPGPSEREEQPITLRVTSTPPWLATAPRRSSRCLSSTPAYRSPIRRSNRVDPSMSVNTKVTVPPGKGASTRSRTRSSGPEPIGVRAVRDPTKARQPPAGLTSHAR